MPPAEPARARACVGPGLARRVDRAEAAPGWGGGGGGLGRPGALKTSGEAWGVPEAGGAGPGSQPAGPTRSLCPRSQPGAGAEGTQAGPARGAQRRGAGRGPAAPVPRDPRHPGKDLPGPAAPGVPHGPPEPAPQRVTVASSSSGLGPAHATGTCTPTCPFAEASGPVSAVSRRGLVPWTPAESPRLILRAFWGRRAWTQDPAFPVAAPRSSAGSLPSTLSPSPSLGWPQHLPLSCFARCHNGHRVGCPRAKGPSGRGWGACRAVAAGRPGSRRLGPQHLLQDRGPLFDLHGGFTVCPHT